MKTYVDRFKEHLETWDDNRAMDKREILAVYMFTKHIVNLADDGGWSYIGHSYKVGDPLDIMTVKANLGDDPVVMFVSGRGMLECMGIFIRKCELEIMEWRPDRYRTI